MRHRASFIVKSRLLCMQSVQQQRCASEWFRTDGTTVEFTPQASRTWGKGGGVADGHFATSVAVFSLSAGGAMLEAAASGSKFRFRPIN